MNDPRKTGPRVFVTQVPNRRDLETNVLSPAVNISPASEHGEIVILMPASASFFATKDLVDQLRAGLRDYSFEKGDSVMCLGDPAIIACVGALLMEKGRSFNILRWDKFIHRYVSIKVTI